jgi:hypothetical protein
LKLPLGSQLSNGFNRGRECFAWIELENNFRLLSGLDMAQHVLIYAGRQPLGLRPNLSKRF